MKEFNLHCKYRKICQEKLKNSARCKTEMENCGLPYSIFKVSREAAEKGILPVEIRELAKEIEKQALEIYRDKARRFGVGQMIEKKIRSYLTGPEGANLPEASEETKREIWNQLRLRPDIVLDDKKVKTVIELFNWWDSNKFRSAMMQGYMLKKKFPSIKYFILIFNHFPNEIDRSQEIHLEFAMEDLRVVDGVYGFVEMPNLIAQIRAEGQAKH